MNKLKTLMTKHSLDKWALKALLKDEFALEYSIRTIEGWLFDPRFTIPPSVYLIVKYKLEGK